VRVAVDTNATVNKKCLLILEHAMLFHSPWMRQFIALSATSQALANFAAERKFGPFFA
jgi:hypothetical protein